jgi:hypothetical protein
MSKISGLDPKRVCLPEPAELESFEDASDWSSFHCVPAAAAAFLLISAGQIVLTRVLFLDLLAVMAFLTSRIELRVSDFRDLVDIRDFSEARDFVDAIRCIGMLSSACGWESLLT